MSLFGRKKKVQNGDTGVRTKDFFDCILPGTMKFFANYYIVGDTYRCVWVIREYPPTTEEQAILAQLADRTGVTLRLYHRRVTPVEEKQIVNNAARKNRLMAGDHDITQAMEAEGNLQDVQTLLATMRNNREILLHCSVYMELKARSMSALESLQSDISMELTSLGEHKLRSGKLAEDHLYNPLTIHLLQQACWTGDYNKFKAFCLCCPLAGTSLATSMNGYCLPVPSPICIL